MEIAIYLSTFIGFIIGYALIYGISDRERSRVINNIKKTLATAPDVELDDSTYVTVKYSQVINNDTYDVIGRVVKDSTAVENVTFKLVGKYIEDCEDLTNIDSFLGIDIYKLRREIADVARMHLQKQEKITIDREVTK